MPGPVVFAYLDEPPFCWPRPGAEPAGCDVELARHVLSAIGVETVEMRLATFAELIPGLVEGRWHMTTGLFVTPERSRAVAFSRPIWALPDGLMVRAGNPRGLSGYETVARHDSARLAVVTDQVQRETARRAGVPDARIVVVGTQDEAARAVREGVADAYASVAMAHRGHLDRSGARDLAAVAVARGMAGGEGAPGAFAFARGLDALREQVDAALERFLGSPDHVRLLARYGIEAAEFGAAVA